MFRNSAIVNPLCIWEDLHSRPIVPKRIGEHRIGLYPMSINECFFKRCYGIYRCPSGGQLGHYEESRFPVHDVPDKADLPALMRATPYPDKKLIRVPLFRVAARGY
jgi:hypothetical protein